MAKKRAFDVPDIDLFRFNVHAHSPPAGRAAALMLPLFGIRRIKFGFSLQRALRLIASDFRQLDLLSLMARYTRHVVSRRRTITYP